MKRMYEQPDASKQEKFSLSERELEIFSMLVKGMSYKMIADAAKKQLITGWYKCFAH